MTKKPLIMIIDDNPVPEVRMALAAEHHERTSEFGRLCNAGHVKPVNDENPALITVRIEEETFTEERSRFPSTNLMARLQLAIAAGQSCKNDPKMDMETHQLDAYAYAAQHMQRMAPRKYVSKSQLLGMGYGKSGYTGQTIDMTWMDENAAVSEAVAQGYANVAKQTRCARLSDFTATVKPLKGIRP